MYDNVCKFMAEMFSEDFANWLLGFPVRLTELKPTELSLEPIRADSLIFLQSNEVVLHIEFQTEPDESLPFRMADYRLRVYRRFPDKDMVQVVIYLKKTNSELVNQTSFRLRQMSHEFNVIRLWEQATESFFKTSGLLPFAVLSQTEQPIAVLSQVATAIDNIPDRRRQSNLAASAAVLAGLVLEQTDIRRILRSEIMRESVIYQEILAEGESKGEQKGEKRAKERIALNLLREGMAIAQIAKITELTVEEVEALQARINTQNQE